MRLRGKLVGAIEPVDLASLHENQVGESRLLDYKLELPGNSTKERMEFLADATALANTAGGVIVYGIREAKDSEGQNTGLPQEIIGIPQLRFAAEEARLISMLNDAVSPAIGGVAKLQEVANPAGGDPLLVLGIPQGFAGPHMVTLEKSNKFWRRSESGKYQPAINELRSMFNEHSVWSEAAEMFRAKRLARTETGDVAGWLYTGSPAFFHVLPLGRLDVMLDLSGRYQELLPRLFPPGSSGGNGRYNSDGLMGYHQPDTHIRSYTQLFRFGGLEGYDSGYVRKEAQSTQLAGEYMLRNALDWFPKSVELLATRLDVVAPYALGLAVKGVRNAQILGVRSYDHGEPINVSEIVLPLVVINVANPDTVREALYPMFDVIWQSAGHPKAPRWPTS
ncbi:MAG TPA: ATP-binding protein [Gemmatimonadaceae bacterium]|nr:ATP-binding protein [Gemmatimonadaceae bacterium]